MYFEGYRLYSFSLSTRFKVLTAVLTKAVILLGCYVVLSGFGGLQVACWPLVPKFAGSHPAEAVGFLGRKNPQHTFLRRGSKAVGTMS
jgi:hypothetical protein